MNKQVLDVEQMKHLQELGLELKQSIIHYYKVANIADANWHLSITNGDISKDNDRFKYIPAYTLQDVLDLLPISVNWNRLFITFYSCEIIIKYSVDEYSKPIALFGSEQMIDVAYEMLCWCIGNGHVKTGKEGRK